MGNRAIRTCGASALVALLACAGLASPAQADRGPAFALTVDRHPIHSGEPFTATATATTRCAWILEFDGDRRTADARTLVTTYTAPPVSRPTKVPLHGTCFHDPSRGRSSSDRGGTVPLSDGSGQRIAVTVPPSWRQTLVITVLPPSSAVSPPGSGGGPGHAGGGLPHTGGPALWILLTGLGAVLVGGAAVRNSPRRLST